MPTDQAFRFVVHQTGDRRRQFRLFLFSKVAGPFLVLRGNGHSNLVDGLITIRHIEGHVEVVIRVLELILLQAHFYGAGFGGSSFICTVEAEVVLKVVQFTVCGLAVAADFVLLAVVIHRAVLAGDGHGHIQRINNQLAVLNHESDSLEVCIRVGKVVLSQFHVIGTGILTADAARTIEGKVIRRVQFSIFATDLDAGYIIAGYRMALAIISDLVTTLGNGHNRIDLADRLVAVIDREGYFLKVSIFVRKLVSVQAHVFGARVSLRRCRDFGHLFCRCKGEICRRIQIGVGLHFITGDRMRFTVVGRGVVCTGDGYGRVDRVDRLIAVRHFEGDLGKVRALIGKLFFCQTHVRGAGILLRRSCFAAESEVVYRIEVAAEFHIISGDGMVFAVIIRRVGMTGDGHNHFINGCDGLIAVRHIEGNVCEVSICIRKQLRQKAHICGAFVRPGDQGVCRHAFRGREGEVSFLIQVTGDIHVVSADTVGLTVKGVRAVVSGNRYRRVDLLNCLVAVRHIEFYSTEIRVRVRKLRGFQAHVLGAGIGLLRFVCSAEGNVMINIIQRGICCSGISRHRMLFAIVRCDIIGTDHCYGHIDGLDHQSTVFDHEGHIFEVAILVLEIFRLQIHIIGAGIRSVHAGVRGALQLEVILGVQCGIHTVDLDALHSVARYGMLRAVIVAFAAVLSDRYRRADRVDRLVTVRHIERDCTEVRICVRELRYCQTHVRGAGFRPRCGSGAAEGEVMVNIIQCAGGCRSITTHAMCRAIIGRRVVRTGNGYGRVDRVDGLITVRNTKRHIKVTVRIRKLAVCQAHVRGTCVCPGCDLAAAEGDVVIDIIQCASRCRGIACHRMCCTVVRCRVARAGDGHCHIHRINNQLTIHDREGYVREVGVGIGEVIRLQFHIIGTGVRSTDAIGTAEGEVSFGVELVADGYIVAANRVLLTVIGDFVAVFSDGHRYIDRVDSQLAVYDHEGHVREVIISIGEVSCLQLHVIRTGIRSADAGSSAEGEVILHIIQFAVRLCGVARHGMLFTIEVYFATVLGDGNRCIDRSNGLVAIRHVEGDIGKVLVRILELFFRQAHIRGAGIRSCDPQLFIHVSRTREGEVCLRVQMIADFNIITADAVFVAVIIYCAVLTGDGHDHFVYRYDFLITVSYVEGYRLEVIIGVGELIFSQSHILDAGIRLRCCSGSAECEVSFGIQRVADFNIIATDAVILAVIGRRVVMSGDGHHYIDRLDNQRTVLDDKFNICEVVVGIGKVIRCQFHIIGTGVRSAGAGRAAEGKVIFSIQCGCCVADLDTLHIIAGHGVFFAVIVNTVAVLGDRHRCADRIDHQLPVLSNYKCHIEVVIVVGEVIYIQPHRIGSGFRFTDAGLTDITDPLRIV